jgi:hypothetical protein
MNATADRTEPRTLTLKATKRAAIALNRWLAWAMLALPVVALMAGWNWVETFLPTVGLLAAHAVLSLALFGGPSLRAAAGRNPWAIARAWLLGLAPKEAGARERLIVAAWAIVLCIAWPAAAWRAILALNAIDHGGARWVLAMACVLFVILVGFSWRYPIAVGAHIAHASVYAARRWGVRETRFTLDEGIVLGLLYVFVQLMHFVVTAFKGPT